MCVPLNKKDPAIMQGQSFIMVIQSSPNSYGEKIWQI